jgi:glycine cleavage system aminomethyltransferase T
MFVNRMNPTQASIYCLGGEEIDLHADGASTETTEATLLLALFGESAFLVTEKLTALDLLAPAKRTPFLHQGPFCHVPCQVVTMARETNGSGGILMSCSRGYAQSMIEAILHAGVEFGLRPAGELRFNQWLEEVNDAG